MSHAKAGVLLGVVGALLLALILADPIGLVKGLVSGYIESEARKGLQGRVDSLQQRVVQAESKAEAARRLSDSLSASAAESESTMRLFMGKIAPLQGKVAELERFRKELGAKEGFSNDEIKDVGRFVDSLLLYRDSVLGSLPR